MQAHKPQFQEELDWAAQMIIFLSSQQLDWVCQPTFCKYSFLLSHCIGWLLCVIVLYIKSGIFHGVPCINKDWAARSAITYIWIVCGWKLVPNSSSALSQTFLALIPNFCPFSFSFANQEVAHLWALLVWCFSSNRFDLYYWAWKEVLCNCFGLGGWVSSVISLASSTWFLEFDCDEGAALKFTADYIDELEWEEEICCRSLVELSNSFAWHWTLCCILQLATSF